MRYDNVGRPAHQRVRHNGRTLLDKSYVWSDNLRLQRTLDTINGRSVRYDYDAFGSLSGAVYGDGSRQWRNPDAMGNVYDTPTVRTGLMGVADSCVRTGSGGIIMTAMATLC